MSLINRENALRICDNAIDLWKGQLGEGALIAVRKSILALPDADDGWIPVEEKPPENADTKLLTHEIHFTNGVIKRDVATAYYDDENEDWLTESENPEILCHPLAWRDLPKPYEPKEDK